MSDFHDAFPDNRSVRSDSVRSSRSSILSTKSLKPRPSKSGRSSPTGQLNAPLLKGKIPKAVPEEDDGWLLAQFEADKYCVVQWETAVFFTYNDPAQDGDDGCPDGLMVLGMTRLGSKEGTSRVQWGTYNNSAMAGMNYVPVKNQVVEFAPGESFKEVTVQIIPSKAYSGVLELGCHIDESSAEGCSVGKYLHTSTIKIIDVINTFPTKELEKFVKYGNEEAISRVSPSRLIYNFVTLCWANPVTRQGSIKMIIAHQYQSARAVLNILIMLFVVRTLQDGSKSSEAKRREMIIYGAMWFFPFLLSHYLSFQQNFWKVGGSLKKQYQVLLLKKFLNYTDVSRAEVSTEQLLMGMVRDVTASVMNGYIGVVDLVFGTMLHIFYLILTMIFIGLTSPTGIKIMPIIAILSVPIFIVAFLWLRQQKMFRLRQKQFIAENIGIKHVISTVMNYQVIADYDRRTYMVKTYEKDLDEVNSANSEYHANVTNSKHFAPWITTTLVAAYIMIGGDEVISGTLLLSTFLSTIALFQSIGGEFEKAYIQSLQVTSSYASIAELTHFLNLPIDTADRLHANRARRKYGRELRRAELKNVANGTSTRRKDPTEAGVDLMPITLKNVSYQYNRPLKEEYQLLTKFEQAMATLTQAKKAKLPKVGAENIPKKLKPASQDIELGAVEKKEGEHFSRFTQKISSESIPDPEHNAATKLQSLFRTTMARRQHKRKVFMDRGGLERVSMEIKQGQLVAVLGDHAQGKGTVLRLLAGELFPRVSHDSVIFIPPHLRIVQVTENPFILGQESVFGNVMYGIKAGPKFDEQAFEIRAKEILVRLDLSLPLIHEYFHTKGHLGPSGARITRVDRQIISLARAFLMNPELLVIHKADALLDDDHAHRVQVMLIEYVHNRGVLMDPTEPLIKRRKRTLIFSARLNSFTDIADVRFIAKGGTVIQEENKRKRRNDSFSLPQVKYGPSKTKELHSTYEGHLSL